MGEKTPEGAGETSAILSADSLLGEKVWKEGVPGTPKYGCGLMVRGSGSFRGFDDEWE